MGLNNKTQLLDINYLKENHIRIYYFGLGFIQVVLNQYERVHFYSDALMDEATAEGWHNHRYNFKSTILKGDFLENLGELVDGEDYYLTNVSCAKDKELPYEPKITVGFDKNKCFHYTEGDTYYRFFNQFHTVESIGNTITYLERSDYVTDFAQVVYEKTDELICPFAKNYDVDMLWEMVEEIINAK